jgi:hypothetical protein
LYFCVMIALGRPRLWALRKSFARTLPILKAIERSHKPPYRERGREEPGAFVRVIPKADFAMRDFVARHGVLVS